MTSLAKLIAQVESNGNRYAMRFEPAVYASASAGNRAIAQETARKWNHCSRPTGAVIISTSWGLYQIMGFNLYSLGGIEVPIGLYLSLSDLQAIQFEGYCKKNGIWIEDVDTAPASWWDRFALAYNGPAALPDYPKRMREEYQLLTRKDKS